MGEPSAEDYHIGWICALEIELTASHLFFDETHDEPTNLDPKDGNTYIRGRMGRHNVVMAVLPINETGTNSAAMVTRDMVRSYRNLKVVLMVGVGGGAPTVSNDIRLGDVVVSTKSGSHGAVKQYDFGKERQGKDFEHTGYLDLPPSSINTAIQLVRVKQRLSPKLLSDKIESALGIYDHLKDDFGRPDPSTDQLFRSDYIHVDQDGACDGPKACDTTKLLRQGGRSNGSQAPTVHYGLIASGNRVMRDAERRDKLATEDGVLCFEMEAAGMMRSCPCLVVRGICDYSDSHKNKGWQGYASMAAAAYAKDLLEKVLPQKVAEDRKLSEIKQILSDDMVPQVTETKEHAVKIRELLEGDQFRQWISSHSGPEYGQWQSDQYDQAEAGTCRWFLESNVFNDWRSSPGQVLFCPGIQGAGKTTMASMVIHELTQSAPVNDGDTKQSVAYIFYKEKEQANQKEQHVLLSILKQLIQKVGLPVEVETMLKYRQSNNERPTIREITTALRKIIESSCGRVFIVIDALDESSAEELSKLPVLNAILDLSTSNTMQLNVLVTSRPNELLRKSLVEGSEKRLMNFLSLKILAADPDIRSFLGSNLTSPSLERDPSLKGICVDKIAKVSSGMFLLARLLCVFFSDDVLTPKEISDEIKKISYDHMELKDAYDSALRRIMNQRSPRKKSLALAVLRWIVHAPRRLTTLELQHALSTKPGIAAIDEKDLIDLGSILSSCAGLVHKSDRQKHQVSSKAANPKLTDQERTNLTEKVELIHSSAQLYLHGHPDINHPADVASIPVTCATYLGLETFGSGPCRSEMEFKRRKNDNPFFIYASSYWGLHARDWVTPNTKDLAYSKAAKEVETSVVHFLKKEPNVLASIQAYASRFPPGFKTPKRMKRTTALHLSAKYGLKSAVESLLKDSDSPDAPDSFGNTPFMNAVQNKHFDVGRLFLPLRNLDLDARDPRRRTALSIAAAAADGAQLVSDLIQSRRVDVESKDTGGRTALSYAAAEGHLNTVRLLVEDGGAKFEQREGDNLTPVARAAMRGRKDIVEFFMARRPSVAVADSKPTTKRDTILDVAFLKAAEHGKTEMITSLLDISETPIDINYQDHRGRTGLWHATKNVHLETIKHILRHINADVSREDRKGVSPIAVAFQSENATLIEALLRVGGAKTQIDGGLWSALSKVAQDTKSELTLIRYLERFELDGNARDEDGRTPLHWAASHAFVPLMQIFLQQPAVEPDLTCHSGRTPLWDAVNRQHATIVSMLLETRRVNINIRASCPPHRVPVNAPTTEATLSCTPFELAIRRRNHTIVTMLLDTGRVNLRALDALGRPPLIAAIEDNLTEIAKLIIQSDSSAFEVTFKSRTPLMIAAEKGNTEVLRFLLDRNANPNIWDDQRQTALSLAILSGSIDVVRLLTETTIDPNPEKEGILRSKYRVLCNLRDEEGLTPLFHAVRKGDLEIIKHIVSLPETLVCLQDGKGRTPLHIAIDRKCADRVGIIAPLSQRSYRKADETGYSPLTLAVRSGDVSVVEELLKVPHAWLDVNKRSKDGSTALSTAVRKNLWRVVERFSEIQGIDLNQKDKAGRSPLIEATAGGKGQNFLEALRLGLAAESVDDVLISQRLFVQSFDSKGSTALVHAIKKGDATLVTRFLRSGRFDVNRPDKASQTPLLVAISTERPKDAIIKALLSEASLEVNIQHRYGRTALSHACESGKLKVVRRLLEHPQIDANFADENRRTPLSYAAGNGHEHIVKSLVQLGPQRVNVNYRDRREITPLVHAIHQKHGDMAVAELLKAKSLKPNSQGQHQRTPLMEAARYGKMKIVQMLLADSRVQVSTRDPKGNTAVWHARDKGHTAIVDFLAQNA